MIVTSHQPNLLPGASVMSKIEASDVVIWSDEMQFSRGGFTNRNRLPDGKWFTVPIEKGATGMPINRVRIVDLDGRGWRTKVARRLRRAWPGEVTEELCAEIARPYRLLVGLNVALLGILCDAMAIETQWVFQSHLDGGHAPIMVSDDREELKEASDRLAMMVYEVGGDVYLSGPSGRNYLDESPFRERGIDVVYWSHHGPNPCALAFVQQKTEVNT